MTSHAGGGDGNVWYKLVYICDARAGLGGLTERCTQSRVGGVG